MPAVDRCDLLSCPHVNVLPLSKNVHYNFFVEYSFQNDSQFTQLNNFGQFPITTWQYACDFNGYTALLDIPMGRLSRP